MRRLLRPKFGFDTYSFRLDSRNLTIMQLPTGKSYTALELKKKYFELIKIYHPDIAKNQQVSSQKFTEITRAYNELVKELETDKGSSPKVKVTFRQEEEYVNNTYGMGREEYEEFLKFKKEMENREKEKEKNQWTDYDHYQLAERLLWVFLFLGIAIRFWPTRKAIKDQDEFDKYLIMRKRHRDLRGVPELSEDECRKHELSELLQMEKMKIARIPEELYENILDNLIQEKKRSR